MCKILSITGLKEKHQAKAWNFIKASIPTMTARDKDGVGYIAADGQAYWVERWTNPKDAFKLRLKHGNDLPKSSLNKLKNCLDRVPVKYNAENFKGQALKPASSIALHSRMATCALGIDNTHPFTEGETALIHNGVISNVHELLQYKSSCDSETILNEYLNQGVNIDASKIGEMARNLKGYYACVVVSKDETGRQIIDIFKNEQANLIVAYIPELETEVYCTQFDIVVDAARVAGFKQAPVLLGSFKSGLLLRLDALTGEVILKQEFDTSYRGNELNTIDNGLDNFYQLHFKSTK